MRKYLSVESISNEDQLHLGQKRNSTKGIFIDIDIDKYLRSTTAEFFIISSVDK